MAVFMRPVLIILTVLITCFSWQLRPLSTLAAPSVPTIAVPSESATSPAVPVPFKKQLRTFIVPDGLPYTFVNKQGKPDGFSVDLLQAVTQVMDFDLEMLPSPWDQARKALENGDIDLLPLVAYSKERAEVFDFSVPHTITYDAIFTRKGGQALDSIEDLRGKSIIVMRNDAAHDFLCDKGMCEHLLLARTLPDALRLLAEGKADGALMPKLVGLLIAKNLNLMNLVASDTIVEAYNRTFSFAVKKGNFVLLERLNQGLNLIKATGKYDEIYARWFGVLEPSRISLSIILRYVALALLSIGVLVGILVLWNLSLRKRVALRTHSLEMEIVERRKAEQALRQSEGRYRQIVETAKEGIWVIGPDTLTTFVNEKMAEMLGYPSNEMIGKPVTDFMFEEDVPNHHERMKARLQGISESYERRFRRKDGQTVWTTASASPMFDEAHHFLGAFSMLTDLTEHRRVEEALFESKTQLAAEKRFRTIFDSHSAIMLLIDSESRTIIDANGSAAKFYGYSINELRNMPLQKINRPSPDDFNTKMQSLLNNEVTHLIMSHQLANGEIKTVEVLSSPILLNEKIHLFSVIHDVTERIQAEMVLKKYQDNLELLVASRTAEILRQKEIAEKALRVKKEFLTNMSHEIRTPLNAIVGFSQILSKQAQVLPVPHDFKQHLLTIQNSGNNLSELITNILDLSKIDAGKIEVTLETINLKQLIQGIYNIHKGEANKHQIQFNYDFSSSLPEFVTTDRNKLNQILMNLLSNAIKFTASVHHSEGKNVRIQADVEKTQEGSWLLLKVKDEGIGISKKDQQVIFDAFVQVDGSLSRKFEGAGLGLSLTKQMTELLGGTIRVESVTMSELEKAVDSERFTPEGSIRSAGSTFTVRIPLIEADAKETRYEDVKWDEFRFSKDNRILAVEDNVLNQKMIQVLFQELGLEIELAESGPEGIKKTLSAIEQNTSFDLILMDLHLPEMDGLETSRHIRLFPECANIPIVLLSADAFALHQKAAQSVGILDYLLKPLQAHKLLQVLAKYLKQEPLAESESEAQEKTRFQEPMPDEVKARLLEEFKTLSKIKPFYTRRIELQLQQMMALCEDTKSLYHGSYDSPYLELLKNIQAASNSRNTELIPNLIADAIARIESDK
ncbi:PAS domain S-box protein [Deltaproteobacteria bacterium TL4]